MGNQARPHPNPHSLSILLPHICLPLSVSHLYGINQSAIHIRKGRARGGSTASVKDTKKARTENKENGQKNGCNRQKVNNRYQIFVQT